MNKYIILILLLISSISMVMAGPQVPDVRDPQWESKWLNKLEDQDVNVRAEAALKLANAGCTDIQNKLIDMARNEESYSARIVAVVALTKIGDEQVVEFLRDIYFEESRQTVRTVINGAINILENQMA